MTLEVLVGGLASTIQDAGRPDWTHLGVPPGGAADPWSLAVANLLIGNDPAAAALEMTLVGATLLARRSMVIGLAGADLGGRVVRGDAGVGRRLAPGRSHRIQAGETVAFPGDATDRGARAYLALPDGIDVPAILGSRSTCLAAGFGGLDGRTLRSGDLLRATKDDSAVGAQERPERIWPAETPWDVTNGPTILRVLPGPALGLDALVGVAWRVGAESDRVGVRLDGEPLQDGIGGEVVSHGVTWGAIQVPPDGRPIVLGPDHQTTGGYPILGVVIFADRPVLGQLRPGEEVHLQAVDRDEALAAVRAQRVALEAGESAMRDALVWDELARSAGG